MTKIAIIICFLMITVSTIANNSTNPRDPKPVFVSWTGFNMTTNNSVGWVWGYNVSVQMIKIPYEKGYIGIGWNSKPHMTNSTMIIMTNNAWDSTWSCGKYYASGNSPPTFLEKQPCDIIIIDGSLTFTFITDININNMYIVYAYSDEWNYHGNRSGIAYKPVSDYLNSLNVTKNSTIIHSDIVTKSSPIVPRKFLSPPIQKSSSPIVPIEVTHHAAKPPMKSNSSINTIFAIYYMPIIILSLVMSM